MKWAIIINGKGGVGKDEIVKITNKLVSNEVFNFSSISLAKKAAKMLGWVGEKTDEDRKFLSDIKKLSIDYNDQPTNYLIYNLKRLPHNSIGFFHIREPEEIQKFLNKIDVIPCNVVSLLVKREDKKFLNESDNNVDNFKYDCILDNNGTKEKLEFKVNKFLNHIGVNCESGNIEQSIRRN